MRATFENVPFAPGEVFLVGETGLGRNVDRLYVELPSEAVSPCPALALKSALGRAPPWAAFFCRAGGRLAIRPAQT